MKPHLLFILQAIDPNLSQENIQEWLM